MKKTIVLYNPTEGKRVVEVPTLPFSLISIGSILQNQGFRIKIIDGRIEKNAHEKALAFADEALFFGVTTITGKALLDALSLSEKMKQKGVTVVWGGFHASLYPRQTLENKSIDIASIGPSDESILSLALELSKKKPRLEKVKGIWFKKGGEIKCTKPNELQDINNFPMLDYGLVDVEKYVKPDMVPRTLEFITSRGCPHNCAFCSIRTVYGVRWRAFTPERVVEEMAYLAKKYNLGGFHFMDDNFYVDRGRVERICDLLIEKNTGLKFWTACRINYFVSFSQELLEKMKKAGIDTINFGAESGSDRILQLIKKGITREQIIKAVEICKAHSFNTQLSFMIGFPFEKKEDFEQTISVMDEIHNIHPSAEMMLYTFIPFAGTELFDESIKNGFKVPESLEAWGNYKYERAITPWLSKEQKKLFDTIGYIAWFAFTPGIEFKLKKIHLKLACRLLRQIALLRWRTKFFSFPIEWYFVDKLISHY